MSYPSAVATSGAAQTTRPSPATGAIASRTSAISSSLAPAASARPALHSRQTGDDPMATDTATRSRAAVLGSRADVGAGSSPSLASSSTKPSSIIASLRNVSWNLTVWPIHLRSRLTTPFHLVRRRVPSPGWHENRECRASSETSSMSCDQAISVDRRLRARSLGESCPCPVAGRCSGRCGSDPGAQSRRTSPGEAGEQQPTSAHRRCSPASTNASRRPGRPEGPPCGGDAPPEGLTESAVSRRSRYVRTRHDLSGDEPAGGMVTALMRGSARRTSSALTRSCPR